MIEWIAEEVFEQAVLGKPKAAEKCEQCNYSKIVIKVSAMTAYASINKEENENLNPDLYLCPDCAEQYVEHWSEMFGSYYDDRL